MAGNITPRFVNQIKTHAVNIDSAATNVDIFTAGTDGSKIEWLAVTTTDTASARTLSLIVEDTATTTFQIGTIAIAAGAGTVGGVAPENGLDATEFPFVVDDAHGNKHLNIEEGHKLVASVDALTALKKVTVVAGVRDYTSDS